MIKQSQHLIRKNSWFFTSYLLLLLTGLLPLIIYPKGEILLLINKLHGKEFDIFFIFFNTIGHGIVYLYFLILLAFFRLKYLILGATMFLGSGLITQILKRIFDYPRPVAWFPESVVLNFVEGFEKHQFQSFPSGHTTAGFSIFLFISIITPNKRLGAVFAIFACLVAFSRVYLVQHFYIDIYFGSMVGVVGSLFLYVLIESNPRITESSIYNFSLKEKLFGKSPTNSN